jgi:hypothetical protein
VARSGKSALVESELEVAQLVEAAKRYRMVAT